MYMTQCRSCGADVRWLTSEATGRIAPIDAAPDASGNVVIDGAGRSYQVLTAGEREASARPRYTNHFQTCPQRQMWAQKGRMTTDSRRGN